ncbi:MAG: hypothetical protein LIP01_13615, partial [Tannerellaceae bacterium]|nr:hypothetical protein [Tannerellaceae bacterium]
MAQSVLNDALWEKLIEIDKKLDKLSVVQKTSTPKEELTGNKPDFDSIKEEIITEIKEKALLLGGHSDSHFNANRENLKILNDNILKTLKVVTLIWKQQKQSIQPQEENKEKYF